MKNVGIIGSGSWGTALGIIAAARDVPVTLVGRNAATASEIQSSRINARYLPGTVLPQNLTVTAELSTLKECDLILFVVPSKAVRKMAADVADLGIRQDALLLSCIKGIDKETSQRPTEILEEAFPENACAILSGPNHAEEIANKLAAAATIGARHKDIALRLQEFFTLPWFRTYTSLDVVGIEWAGAIKNVFAIASGISEGLGLGDNARAALVTRGLAEMIRLGAHFGGKPETFQGLSGVGDLIATCYSDHSRNNRVGRLLGKGQSLETIVNNLQMVAEGVPNTENIYHAAKKAEIRTPLIDMVYAILYQDKPCQDALQELLSRDPRPETD